MKPWESVYQIVANAVLSLVVACVYALVRKIRHQTWKAAIKKPFQVMGIYFITSSLGILARMGRHNVLAIPAVRILCVVFATIFWMVPVVWFLGVMRRVQKDVGGAASQELLRLVENKWVGISLFLALVFTFTAIFSG